jgi:hypothetical protein
LISGAPLTTMAERRHCAVGTSAPSGGAGALWLLSRFSKVTRCKSGTLSSRYRSNGNVPQFNSKKTTRKFVRNIPEQMDGLSDAPNFPTSF